MPVTQRDAQALTYLAGRLREETRGARTWDEHGTYAVVSKFIGQNLATTAEAVLRHAGDVEAKTPGAINRPFLPAAPVVDNRARPPKKHEACRRCGGWKNNCACQQERRADDEPQEAPPMTAADAIAAAKAALRGNR